MEIAQALKEWRKTTGLSQNAIAEKTGIPQQSYNRWEAEKRSPDSKHIKLIAETFHVSADVLLGIDKSGWEDGETD